jgi:hypothetical protein
MVNCSKCNVPLEEKKVNTTLEVNGKIIVPLRDVPVYRCPKCEYEIAQITHIFKGDKLELTWGGLK